MNRGRVYAGWGFSQAFYREKLHEKALGFAGLEDFMKNWWEAWALSKGERGFAGGVCVDRDGCEE